MAITRVQATPATVTTVLATSCTVTFATPPAVGDAVIAVVLGNSNTAASTSCTDSAGHTYTVAKAMTTGGTAAVTIYYVPVLTATATPFTVTFTGANLFRVAIAIAYRCVGAGLTVDATAGTVGVALTSHSAGPLAPATAAEVILVGAIVAVGSSFYTASPAPPWLQEHEEPFTVRSPAGEINSQVVTAALGTTGAITWAVSANYTAATALVAFKSTGPAVGPGIRGALVAGEATTVTASRAVAFGLDGATHIHDVSGVLQVYGALAVSETVQVGDVSGVTATTLIGRGPGEVLEAVTVGDGLTLTGNVLALPPGTYDAPLSDGDLAAADLIFADGNVIIVQVPT